jgi:hypothetical protein
MAPWQRVESDLDGKLLFRFRADKLAIEIKSRRYTKATGRIMPLEVIALADLFPTGVGGSIMAVIQQHMPPGWEYAGTAILRKAPPGGA